MDGGYELVTWKYVCSGVDVAGLHKTNTADGALTTESSTPAKKKKKKEEKQKQTITTTAAMTITATTTTTATTNCENCRIGRCQGENLNDSETDVLKLTAKWYCT